MTEPWDDDNEDFDDGDETGDDDPGFWLEDHSVLPPWQESEG